jgi:hypothetical protein
MNATELLDALKIAADVMRRLDPTWCALNDVPQTTDVEWDAALAAVEDAVDAAREMA